MTRRVLTRIRSASRARPGGTLLAAAAVALALAFTLPVTVGVLTGEAPLLVASAPKEASGLTLFLKADSRVLPGDKHAEYEIRFGDRVVYPPGGSGAIFPVPKDGTATTFLPYGDFVVGNGDYDVLVRFEGETTRTRIPVDKWVSYVYLHPFDRGAKIQVDVQLSRTTGGLPNDRVITKGELVLELRYRGEDGEVNRLVGPPIKVETDPTKTFQRVEISRSRFNEGSGYYSIEPVFHNHYARGNLWVPKDPTMAQRDPPWNWIHIR